MYRYCLFLGLTALAIGAVTACAETEIGVSHQSGWSDNFYLENPDGWGIFIHQSLPPFFALGFSYKQFKNRFQYLGIMQFGFPPPEADTTRELIGAKASATLCELSIYHIFVDDNKMQLEAGIGIGKAGFDLDLVGKLTNKRMAVEQSAAMATFSVNATVKQFIRPPLALRLGYAYHTMSTMSETTDSFEPFNDVALSSVHAIVLLRL